MNGHRTLLESLSVRSVLRYTFLVLLSNSECADCARTDRQCGCFLCMRKRSVQQDVDLVCMY